jgi:hypothetical protein
VRRHALGHLDRKAERLLHRIEAALTAEQSGGGWQGLSRLGAGPRACCWSPPKTRRAQAEAVRSAAGGTPIPSSSGNRLPCSVHLCSRIAAIALTWLRA